MPSPETEPICGGRVRASDPMPKRNMTTKLVAILLICSIAGALAGTCTFNKCDGCAGFCKSTTGENYKCSTPGECQCTVDGKWTSGLPECTMPKLEGGSVGVPIGITVGILVIVGGLYYYFKVYKKRDGYEGFDQA